MSRSRKKKPISGWTTAVTEKKDKRIANRRWRQKVKVSLKRENEVLPELREVSDVWNFAKDGKVYIPKSSPWIKKETRK